MNLTPNVKLLMLRKLSFIAVPRGGGFEAGLAFLQSKERIAAGFAEAKAWTEQAIALVRTRPDNPYRTDEEIAGAILKKLEGAKK